MKNKKSLKSLGLNKEDVDRDLSEYYKMIEDMSVSRKKVLENWETVEDYVDTLYLLKFVYKLYYKKMDEITGVSSFYSKYARLPFGWDYDTNDFEETMRCHKEKIDFLEKLRKNFDSSKYNVNYSEFQTFYRDTKGKLRMSTIKKYGYSDELLFLQELYYTYIENELSTKELAMYFKKNSSVMIYQLTTLGIMISD
ncbi:MAG: hypothetical protein R3Y24_09450 [Eubacteriales bacterium]